MRKSLVLAMVAVLLCSSMVFAGVPDPTHSGCAFMGQVQPCLFRFASDGSWDKLTVCVTLRDAFDSPVGSCTTSATISNPLAGTSPRFFCSCSGTQFTGVTGPDGVVYFIFDKIGGSGLLKVCITSKCTGNIGICCDSTAYSSSDLNGSCETSGTSTNVQDLGIWGQGYSSYSVYSDYDCNTNVNVQDLGQFGNHGFNVHCP
jgi:hypothetical protein